MKCPICSNVDLVMSERQGVEIDYCPSCRGIWLDRGELERLIAMAGRELEQSQGSGDAYDNGHRSHNEHHHDKHHKDHAYGSHQGSAHGYHRKKNWLAEIFD